MNAYTTCLITLVQREVGQSPAFPLLFKFIQISLIAILVPASVHMYLGILEGLLSFHAVSFWYPCSGLGWGSIPSTPLNTVCMCS